ncbi:ABC transporter ATP-binding protein [Spiroplasma syrphidicola EA-1]|uniref:ABC transporter ATP-binding protein n=1 Tax=Spiroplasma syrphidicola EA-1 TaxID=1276229 RepID=R4UKT3_9MOLU|nr:ABC transporter ATP-binding protein [Spiroplasma syrphidicola]AGM25876.1 ABC transporter ATP-binding protein [Spiroplasma syrphidicola EA-1]
MEQFTVKNLTKQFNKTSGIDKINFSFNLTDIVGFVGANGAGKTTTIKAIFNELKTSAGEVTVNGEPFKIYNKDNKIGFLPDSTNLPQDIKVKEYLELVGILAKINSKELKERIMLLLDMFDLTDSKNKLIRELSAGMQKRAAIAGVMIFKPKFIFMDEPTANLDVEARIEILNIIKSLNQKGIGFFITTHIIDELEKIINKLIIIEAGTIVYETDFNHKKDNIMEIYQKYVGGWKERKNLGTKLDSFFAE